ncbi:MAG: CoA pyrophosphatase [Marinoscillum sp.]
MEDLIGKLEERLKQPLPGRAAYGGMIPRMAKKKISFKFDEEPRKGAVLILLYPDAGLIKFPLIQRPVYEGVHSGQIALPGGRFEIADENLIQTALRETHEEIGVPSDQIEIIGQLSEFMVSASNHLVLPVVGYSRLKPSFLKDDFEVDEIIEAPLDHLLDAGRIKEKEIVTTYGYRLHSPYYDLEGKVVWGATAMMLSEFVQIINDL